MMGVALSKLIFLTMVLVRDTLCADVIYVKVVSVKKDMTLKELKTEIDNIYQVDRGYENLDGRLRKLGANIKRVD